MLKRYKLCFEIWGLLLSLIVMIPNFIWFAIPAPNDILRAKSITEMVDTVASVCQILMFVAICIFRNRESKKLRISPFYAQTRAEEICRQCGARVARE